MREPARGKPFQSKLRPFVGLIRQWRLGRKTYREIARLLREEHGVSIHHTSIHSFVRRRVRRRKAAVEDMDVPPSLPQVPVPPPPSSGSSKSREAIEKLRRKPKPQPKKILFEAPPEDQPLTFITKESANI